MSTQDALTELRRRSLCALLVQVPLTGGGDARIPSTCTPLWAVFYE